MADHQARVKEAAELLGAGNVVACFEACDRLLEVAPGLTTARHLRGMAAARLGRKQQAIDDLSQVWAAQRQNGQAALGLGTLLRECERYEDAIAPLQAASRFPQYESEARYNLARVLTRLRRNGEAIAEYRAVLQNNPRHVEAAANLSFLFERSNQLEPAEQHADLALTLQPANFMAGLTKATIDRRKGAAHGARKRLEELLHGNTSLLNRSIVLNQLGQVLDQQQDWLAAFERFRESNRVLRERHPLGVPQDDGSYGLRTISRISHWLSAHPPSTWSENNFSSASDPVFLVGFPRSGTTLLDQVLSAHPQIEVLEEFDLFDEVRQRWVDGEGLEELAAMDGPELDAARNVYLEAMRARRQHVSKPVVIDKLPLNMVYLFLIHRVFPRSKVILVVRDPRDACLSCFFQAFDLQGAMPYFLDLDDTSRYYDAALGLARDSLAVIGNPVHQVRYEDLVVDLESKARSLLAFLGMDWHPSVLEYRRLARERTIHTPSYQQVVQPLHTASIGRWKNYRESTEPAFDRLGPWVEYFGYDPA